MHVENLRSPHHATSGLVYFARMIDKIRLHAAGTLPGDYIPNLGIGFDSRCVNLLGIAYPALVERVTTQGGADEELLEWACNHGRRPEPEQIEIWNDFMSKRGWKDAASEVLARRKREAGFEARTEIETMFDYIDADEA